MKLEILLLIRNIGWKSRDLKNGDHAIKGVLTKGPFSGYWYIFRLNKPHPSGN